MSVVVYIPDLAEFAALVKAAEVAGSVVLEPRCGYRRIEAQSALEFSRTALGLGPALWNSALSGGFQGHIAEFGRDFMRIVSEEHA